MSFQGKVSPRVRTNPPQFHSPSNPHTMQTEDCAHMCTQVMEANGEKKLSVRTLVGLLSPWCAPKQCSTNRGAIKSILGIVQILSTAGFDLIWLVGDPILNHSWRKQSSHLRRLSIFSRNSLAFILLLLKAWLSSAARLCLHFAVYSES